MINEAPAPTLAPIPPHEPSPSMPAFGQKLVRWILYLIGVVSLTVIVYWWFIASDRFVSEASIIIRKTDAVAPPALDLSLLVGGSASINRTDQMLLREYLLSVDMLKKLDAALHLREHYSDRTRDVVSRLWVKDQERFHRHYLAHTAINYDDFVGVVRIRVQAYDAVTAQAIAKLLVAEGERYMNQLGHDMADTQVAFLLTQVEQAQQRVQGASKRLLTFQNATGMISAQAAVESANTLIAGLEAQRAQKQTELQALPKHLETEHTQLVRLRQAIVALDQQIALEKNKLTNPDGTTLNANLEEFHRLQMELTFTQELYTAAATALEKGRVDSARLLEKVSVIQTPTLAEYPVEPRRIYNAIATILFSLLAAGIVVLTYQIIRDHAE
jgi:capsular polysaccharide transport system permease protein